MALGTRPLSREDKFQTLPDCGAVTHVNVETSLGCSVSAQTTCKVSCSWHGLQEDSMWHHVDSLCIRELRAWMKEICKKEPQHAFAANAH